ncbi:hypothetical protein RB653_010148 [Dictyostelium firmibasis]|uniref:FNIP repeat-containing protein n=1 Tax=Dictyostelium firmibasis TaxID=79012 RepID=A0AAN7YKS1_9MYCE
MDELRLHSSFYKSTKSLLAKLFSGGAEFNLINNFITITNFNIKELSKIDSNENGADINDQLPLLHSTIYSNNPKLLQQISYLVNTLKVNIDLVHDDLTALDLSAKCNNFQSFVLLVELGAGKVFNPSIISKFYNSLPSNQKLDFKPHLQTLFHTNPNAAWCISLNCLLPECGSQLPIDSKIKTISTVVKGRRKISDEHYYSLFNKEDGTPMKKNQYDKRSIPSIRDDYGNCIYIKFDHQFPGIEIAVSKLSEFLFGHCSPCCELGSIEDFPILLVQEVNGEPLIDILEKNPEIIDKIDASNISKQLIMGILTNNSNGDLNNFIVTTTKKKVHYSQNNLGNIESEKQYKIYSIENEHCFMPSTSKKSKKSEAFFKKFSLHVMPSILLFNQMNDPVHQDVIDSISSLNIDNFCEKWLKFLENYDSTSLNHFKDIQQGHDRKKSIVGVTFGIEVSKILYPKLIHLKHLTNKNERTSINHLQLLEYLEPMVSNRIKPILNNFCTIIDRYDQLKQSIQNCQTILVRNPSYNIEHIRNIHHPSAFLLEPFDTQNIQEINNKNISDDYGPEKALRELDRMKKRYSNINQIFNYIQDGVIQNISDFDLEEYLKKANFENLTKNQHSLLFKAFKSRSIGTVHIKNCDNLQLKILKKLNLNNLTEIDFSGCKNLEYIKNGKFLNSPLNLPSLKTLIIRNCKKLFGLRIECLNLETLIASDCISLKDFDVNSPILKTLDLNSSIKNSNVFNFLKRFKKLTFLDISNSKGIETIVELEFPELEVLEAKSISNCVKIILGLPVIESINFEDCIDMREIKSKSNHSMIWNALKSCPNKIIFEKKQINLNLIGSDIKELPIRNETEVELVDTNYFQLFNNEEKKKNYYKIQQGLEIGDIPNIVNSIKIHDGFCQILKPGILPDSVKTLYLNDIKVPLEVGSIPSSVKNLTLNNDFGRVLTKDIIPTGVQFLDIHNIKLQLEIESIPSSVTYLNFHDGFDHILYPGIIPEGVKILHFQNLKKPLVVGSIPNSVKRLTITEAVPFKLIPGIIPSMVNFLYLYDVKEELQIGSIPSSVTSLVLNYKFNSPLLPYLIPHSVRSLDLYNLNQQLLPGSIPSSVEILSFQDGFNLKLISSLIPKDVLTLHLHDIKQPLEIGSIPSVKSLILHDKFNQRLSVGIIPEGVEFLNLYNLKQQLEVGSIPNSIKEITLGKNFDKEIPPFVIPIGTKVIIANQLN